MINFVLCDDSVPSLNRLSKLLEAIFIRNNLDAKIGLRAFTPESTIEYVNNNKVDLLFLDINLKSSLSGCDVADIVRKNNKDIYIVSRIL